MKKNLVQSYIAGLVDSSHGERYGRIMRYFLPEFITSLLLYSMPIILDAYFIGGLKSTALYSTLGATNTLVHWIVKVSEGLSVGTVLLVGQYNGKGDCVGVGNVIRDAFWSTLIIGSTIAGVLYFGAYWIYLRSVPLELVPLGVPFLRLRAISILCMFIFMAFVGFLRGIKNTRAPMKIFVAGAAVFLLCDYMLIYGKWGAPTLGLQGSAVASIIQYLFMLVVIIGYTFWNKKNYKYIASLLTIGADMQGLKRLIAVSWLVVLDKSIMAFAYIWLLWMMKPLGEYGVATFCLVKDMERFAFLPAIACSQIITFLVSNDLGKGNFQDIKANIKKITFLASGLVFSCLVIFSLWPKTFMQYFDKTGDFIDIAALVFPIISSLVFFDLLQLILSGALRAVGDVKTVLMVRVCICFGYFFPVSYIIAYHVPIAYMPLKFVLIYGAFYVGNGIMSVIYIKKMRSDQWVSALIKD